MNARARIAAFFGRFGNRQSKLIVAFALVLAAFCGTGAPSAALADVPSASVKATEVGYTSALAGGTIDPAGSAVSYHYEYITEAQYFDNEAHGRPAFQGAEFAGFNSTNAAGPAEAVELGVTTPALLAGTTYRLRLVAENADGASSSAKAFTTQAATPAPVAIDPVSAPAYSTITVSGSVDPEEGNVNPIPSPGGTPVPIAWEFQVNREGKGWEFASGTPVGGSQVIVGTDAESKDPITVEEQIEGLAPDASYEVRLRAFRAGAEAVSPEPYGSFTTIAVDPPSVTVNPADSVTPTDAHLSGEVTAGDTDPLFDSKCSFILVTDARFQAEGFASREFKGVSGVVDPGTELIKAEEEGYVAPLEAACEPNPVKGTGPAAVEGATITRLVSSNGGIARVSTELEPNQTYHLRLAATNAGGTTSEDAPTFTTAAAPPAVRATNADHIAATSATIRGWVNPRHSATTYYFLWGSEDCSANPCQSIPLSEDAPAGSGNSVVSASQSLTELDPETTYHYLLVAENQAGVSEGEDRSFTTAAESDPNCPNEARRAEEPLSFVLGDCRAWELASPGAPGDVAIDSSRTRAAEGEASGLPMAATFSSLVAFGDAPGTSIASEYLTQRTGEPGSSGWTVHGITPPQESLSYLAFGNSLEPEYEFFSPDLTRGVFRAWSPIGKAPNVADVANLYERDDVRSGGAGTYNLLTDSATVQPPIETGADRPWFAGASKNLEHVVFESTRDLTPDATGPNHKLYKSDDGVVRLVKASAACAGQTGGYFGGDPAAPCSVAGIAASGLGPAFARPRYTPRVISDDGSRVNFTSPFGTNGHTVPNSAPGVVSKLFQLDDQGTLATDDDAVVQLSMSEKASPEVARATVYDTASSDGNRVFFNSSEQLTDTPGSGLYMWERKSTNEKQSLAVDATGGSFTLTAQTQPSSGAGTLANGSNEVNGVTGSFTVGQTISGTGIEPGTTVTAVDAGGTSVTLSAPASLDGEENLTAGIEATTNPLAWDASASQVQAELEGLSIVKGLRMIGAGNVAVSGGPGGAGPYTVEFTGALAGVDVMQLSADASGLTGGSAAATVTTAQGIHNLTLIGNGASGVLGASEDGHRVYFAVGDELWFWHDEDGTPKLWHVATLAPGDNYIQFPSVATSWTFYTPLARVTPDGRSLLFEASDGAALPPGYQHGFCRGDNANLTSGLCSEAYVYRADSSTASDPDIRCASCDFDAPGTGSNASTAVRFATGVSAPSSHLSRALSDDGRYVFFNTAAALVPEDTNGVNDAYSYDVTSGELHLLSSGTDPAPSYFLDAGSDGSDAFILTRQPLSGWDAGRAYSLYDVRAGGGFPEPPPASSNCVGDSCHTGAPPPPPVTTPGSATLVDHGNRPQGGKTCPRGTRKIRRKGQVRCIKVRRNHKPSANKNRRTGR